MAFAVTTTTSVREGTTTQSSATVHNVESLVKIEETIADAVTNQAIGLTVDVSALQVFSLLSDRAITVKTNSSTEPQETITLVAGRMRLFQVGDAAIFAGDVSSIFVTNASGGTATLEITCGQNLV